MEQQKVLWIIFSVTLFILVVVVVGFVWFLPKDDEPVSTAELPGETAATTVDPIVWVRESEEIPGITEAPEEQGAAEGVPGDLLLVYGEAESETGTEFEDVTIETTPPGSTTVEVVNVPVRKPASELSPVSTPGSSPKTSVAVEAPATVQVESKPVRTSQAAPEPKPVRVTQYWIQTGSFKSQSRAEENQTKLAEKGWHTRIISRDLNGQTFFRVRLGPFVSEPEASKFLGWIKEIKSFEESYISEVYTTRMVN